jgi:hypothetical protein
MLVGLVAYVTECLDEPLIVKEIYAVTAFAALLAFYTA